MKRMDEIAAMTDAKQANTAWQRAGRRDPRQVPGRTGPGRAAWPLLLGTNIAGAYGHTSFGGQLDYATVGLKDPVQEPGLRARKIMAPQPHRWRFRRAAAPGSSPARNSAAAPPSRSPSSSSCSSSSWPAAAPLLSALGGWSPEEFDKSAVDPYLGGLPLGPLGGISADHWLGVEPVTGRDLFARVVHGAQVSLLIAFTATAIVVIAGTAAGIAAGYFGGRTDAVLSRIMDLTMSFPSPHLHDRDDVGGQGRQPDRADDRASSGCSAGPASPAWSAARRSRSSTASTSTPRGSAVGRLADPHPRHPPGVAGPVIAYTTLIIPGNDRHRSGAAAILGVGVRPPTPSWGQMIAESVAFYDTDPMYFVIPSICLFLAVLAFTLLGDALRDILDPRGSRT